MYTKIDRRMRTPATVQLQEEIKREHFENGIKVKDLAKKYNYSQSTISAILGNKRKLLKTLKINDGTEENVNNFYNNRTLIMEMEKHLFVWIREKQKQNESVSQNSISEKALETYDDLKAELPKAYSSIMDGFRASESWFRRFCERNGIDKFTCRIKNPDGKESASGENGASTSDVDDPVPQRRLVDEVGNSVADTSNQIYIQERNTKDSSLHKLSNCTEYLTNDNIKTEFDNSVSTVRIENNIGDNSILLRSVPTPNGAHLDNSIDKISVKASNVENVHEDEFEAFGKYVAMALRKMPMSNALSVENQIFSAINKERRLILLQNDQSGINIGVGVKMEIEDEPI